jgi:hypothetical protein
MTPAFQSRLPFRKGLGRHRSRFRPIQAARCRTSLRLTTISMGQNFQKRRPVAKAGLEQWPDQDTAAEMLEIVSDAIVYLDTLRFRAVDKSGGVAAVRGTV